MEEASRNSALGTLVRRVTPSVLKKKSSIPDDILLNKELNLYIEQLPHNYNFELHKTLFRIRQEGASLVALQFPEGLLMYACIISDILSIFGKVEVVILADVTYGACCVDDFTVEKLGAQLLVHYGHSCLVPITVTKVKTMYVFVEIGFSPNHLVECVRKNFAPEQRLVLMGTIQFTGVLHQACAELRRTHASITVPQSKPLSAGETLGCTSAVLPACDALIFVADGRFHLEAAMIRNPSVAAYRYDPYSKVLSAEAYDIELMKTTRLAAIAAAGRATRFGLILGTLGRQGNRAIFERLRALLEGKGRTVVPFLMAEIVPKKLLELSDIEAWVQVACPRLSIDWGGGFAKPLLTPYELEVCLGAAPWQQTYPMDYYSLEGGPWANYHK